MKTHGHSPDGVIASAVCEEVGPQTLLLDLPSQHFLYILRLGHQAPDLVSCED